MEITKDNLEEVKEALLKYYNENIDEYCGKETMVNNSDDYTIWLALVNSVWL